MMIARMVRSPTVFVFRHVPKVDITPSKFRRVIELRTLSAY